MFRKLKLAVLIIAIALFGSIAVAEAATSEDCYITLRCTATISVELFSRAGGLYDKTTYYAFGDVSAASTATATNPIGVRNNSLGAITSWELAISSIRVQGVGTQWPISFGDTPGLNRMTMYAKFSTNTITSTDFDIVKDTVSIEAQGAKTYNQGSGYFFDYCEQYTSPEWSYPSSVLPLSYDPSADGPAERHLWIKLLTPTALEYSNRDISITLKITAK